MSRPIVSYANFFKVWWMLKKFAYDTIGLHSIMTLMQCGGNVAKISKHNKRTVLAQLVTRMLYHLGLYDWRTWIILNEEAYERRRSHYES